MGTRPSRELGEDNTAQQSSGQGRIWPPSSLLGPAAHRSWAAFGSCWVQARGCSVGRGLRARGWQSSGVLLSLGWERGLGRGGSAEGFGVMAGDQWHWHGAAANGILEYRYLGNA